MPFGFSITYRVGADWLAGCALVEDWGCGLGWLRTLVPPGRYRGIDGSRSPFTDEIVDLARYRSSVPGVFMRHVLEHNHAWRQVLDNALASFTERMALILFTPMAEKTHERAFVVEIGVPDISFRHEDLTDRYGSDIRWSSRDYLTQIGYGCERVYLLEKPASAA